MNSDYGQKSRQHMMIRHNMERRKKWMRRQYFHALDIAGALCWSMLFVLGAACVLFLVFHR